MHKSQSVAKEKMYLVAMQTATTATHRVTDKSSVMLLDPMSLMLGGASANK